MSNANGGFVSVLLTHLLNFRFNSRVRCPGWVGKFVRAETVPGELSPGNVIHSLEERRIDSDMQLDIITRARLDPIYCHLHDIMNRLYLSA